jgi:hypothetical protein
MDLPGPTHYENTASTTQQATEMGTAHHFTLFHPPWLLSFGEGVVGLSNAGPFCWVL